MFLGHNTDDDLTAYTAYRKLFRCFLQTARSIDNVRVCKRTDVHSVYRQGDWCRGIADEDDVYIRKVYHCPVSKGHAYYHRYHDHLPGESRKEKKKNEHIPILASIAESQTDCLQWLLRRQLRVLATARLRKRSLRLTSPRVDEESSKTTYAIAVYLNI